MFKNLIINCLKNFSTKLKFNIRREALTASSLSSSASAGNAEEEKLTNLLKIKFPQASAVEVQDVSGGCGAMYEVWVESAEFKGLSRVKQHKLITQALKEEIKDMHGLRISTTVPETT